MTQGISKDSHSTYFMPPGNWDDKKWLDSLEPVSDPVRLFRLLSDEGVVKVLQIGLRERYQTIFTPDRRGLFRPREIQFDEIYAATRKRLGIDDYHHGVEFLGVGYARVECEIDPDDACYSSARQLVFSPRPILPGRYRDLSVEIVRAFASEHGMGYSFGVSLAERVRPYE